MTDELDARRYRRIRNGPHSENYGDLYAMTFQGDGDIPVKGQELDRAVDAALSAIVSNQPYINRLIDRLLMPLPATTDREAMALHNEAAQMLHLLSHKPGDIL